MKAHQDAGKAVVLGRQATRSRAAARGYNMIEVMMGLAILAVGASGVIALQKVTILGVTGGRNMSAASTIAAAHLEAIRTDGLLWNSASDMVDATLVSNLMTHVVDCSSDVSECWRTPSLGLYPLGESDVTGTTGTALAAPIAYCTQLRASLIADDTPGPGGAPTMLRIEARTFWAKSGRAVTAECRDADAAEKMTAMLGGTRQNFTGEGGSTVNYGADDYGWVFLSSSLRRADGGS